MPFPSAAIRHAAWRGAVTRLHGQHQARTSAERLAGRLSLSQAHGGGGGLLRVTESESPTAASFEIRSASAEFRTQTAGPLGLRILIGPGPGMRRQPQRPLPLQSVGRLLDRSGTLGIPPHAAIRHGLCSDTRWGHLRVWRQRRRRCEPAKERGEGAHTSWWR